MHTAYHRAQAARKHRPVSPLVTIERLDSGYRPIEAHTVLACELLDNSSPLPYPTAWGTREDIRNGKRGLIFDWIAMCALSVSDAQPN